MGAPQLDASIATLAIIVSAVCDFIADSCSAICIWFGHLYQLTWHEIPWNDLFSVDVQRHGTCNDCCWDKALDGHDTHDAFTRKEITLSNAIYSGNNWWVYSVEPWEIRSSHMYASNGSIESGQGRQPISKNSLNVQMMEMWKREWERQQSAYKTLDKPIDVHLANGTKVLARQGLTSPLSFAKDLGEFPLAALINGEEIWDLSRPIEESCELDWITSNSPMTKEVQELLFRSGSFIFGMAMKQKYGNSSLLGSTAGLSSQGFYRDFLIQKDQRNSAKTLHGLKNDDMHHVNQNDLAEVAKTAKKLAKGSGNFKTLHVSKDIATEMFADSPLHLSYLSELPSNHKISLHSCGQFIDITNGPLIATSKQIKFIQLLDSSSTSLTLPPLSSSGTTPCIPLDLTRVRGIAFSSEDSLNSWTKIQDEAASRDHRVIGKDQKLFYTHPMSPGSIFMLPHGTRIVNRLLAFLRKEYRNFGYQEVVTPMLYNKDLWVKSGHWQNYKEDMFLINDQSSSGVEEKETQSAEQVEFGLKPMNCPGHCLIFASESRSYRELPIRYADFSALHRNEATGALSGLTRVRKFHQDDAHIFCSMDQIEAEISANLDFIDKVYKLLDFKSTQVFLSTRPEKFMGDGKAWDLAEASLKSALTKRGLNWAVNEGDGAFYGPKIDFRVQDALGRSHQTATVQLDFQLPVRFDLKFVASDKTFQSPVIIHRAIVGSVERMMAIMMEHFAGKWPFWLSPRQAMVIPVRPEFGEYAEKVAKFLSSDGAMAWPGIQSESQGKYFHVDADLSDHTLNKKVRDAQAQQYNYQLVVGKVEQDSNTVSIRSRNGEQIGTLSLQDTLHFFRREIQ